LNATSEQIEKVSMPIQEVDDRFATKQFEPIILEEVYYNDGSTVDEFA
jgi:hypothetical protein